MNQLINLLLLSTAACRAAQKNHSACPQYSSRSIPMSRHEEDSSSSDIAPHKTRASEVSTSTFLAALNAADEAIGISNTTGPFALSPLDYDYNALEPSINEQTLRIHHLGNHKNYIDKLNAALAKYPEFYTWTLNELLLFPDRLPSDIQTQVINNGGGDYNHTLMWKILGPQKDNQPSGALEEAIDTQFGTFDNFKQAFKAAGESVFGSGYAYLILNPYGRLLIVTTSDQTTPIPLRSVPLLPLDVWEHAYFLQYQNNRSKYIDHYFNIIDWNNVGSRYQAAMHVFLQDL